MNLLVAMMSPLQEYGNAWSLLFPTFILLINSTTASHKILLAGNLIHLPVAIAYHISVAHNAHPIDNNLRRLDQTVQLLVASIYAYALSENKTYTLLTALYGLFAANKIWQKQRQEKVWVYIAPSIALFTAPILWKKDYKNYVKAIVAITTGSAAAVLPTINYSFLRGWGHVVFHIQLAVFADALTQHLRQK